MGLDATLALALAKINQGPVAVMVDPDGTPVELFVRDGVDLTFGRGLEAVETDVVGVYDLRSTGDTVKLTLNIEEQDIDVVNVLFPDGGNGTTYRGFGRSAGQSQRTLAKKIRIRPWQTRTATTIQIELWKCVPSGDTGLAMKKTAPDRYSGEFQALPDLDQADGSLLGKITLPARS